MLAFFRRLINSKVGIIVTFVGLVVIALAFGLSDVTGLRHSATGGLTGDNVASVGKVKIGTAELRQRVQSEYETFRQQQPSLTMASFVEQGGVEAALSRTIDGIALQQFAQDQGMRVSRQTVDGEIASMPGLQGADGKFNQALYNSILQQRRMSDAQVHADMAQDIYAQHLTAPTISASQVPAAVALPYASLALEKRDGLVGFVPVAAVKPGPAPTDAEVAAFYAANKPRYTVPERRVIRYAIVTPALVKAQATPTAQEIAAAYQAQRASFQPTEKRDIEQVVVLDQASAAGLAAKVKGGASFAAAAAPLGLAPQTLTGITRAAYTQQNSPELAAQLFGAAQGAVVGPVKGPLGYIVAKVDAIHQIAGKSLEQATPELTKALTAQKTQAALGAVHDALDDGIEANATFAELAQKQHLTSVATPALTAQGTNPDDPAAKPDPALAQIVAAGFAAQPGDQPQMVQTAADGSFALVALDRVIAAAPPPLAQIRARVAADLVHDRALTAAGRIANAVIAKVAGGASLAQAVAGAGVPLPAPRPLSATRRQLLESPQGAPPALALLFSMRVGTAKRLAAPDGSGWFLVSLAHLTPGDASHDAALRSTVQAQLGRISGRELVQQFTQAVRNRVGVTRNPAAIARLKAELSGAGGGDDQPQP